MARSSITDNIVQMAIIAEAWEKLRPDKSFGGITLKEFKAMVQSSQDAHAEVVRLEGRMRATGALRDAADARTLELLQSVEDSMKADPRYREKLQPEEGTASTPKRRRKTGRTVKARKS